MTFTTPDLCDAHPDRVRVLQPMLTNYGGRKAFGGPVVTVKCFEDNSLVREQVNRPGRGAVLVVDGGGSLRRSLLGDMLAEAAVENDWSGLIIYGCIRDVDVIHTLDVGVQALATIPLKTEKRGIGDLQIPVTFGGVTFNPGDYVYADNNGVVVASGALV